MLEALDDFLELPDGWRARLDAAGPEDEAMVLWERRGEWGASVVDKKGDEDPLWSRRLL